MNTRKNKYLLFVVFFVAILLAVFTVSPRIERLPAAVVVADDGKLGFAADPGIANFGSVPRGNVGERRIILINYDDFPKKITFAAEGELKSWIYFSENNFVLAKNETRQVAVNIKVPEDAAFSNYSGKIVTRIKRKWL